MVPRKRVDDSRRVLPWALLLSILAHAVLIPALLWFIVLHLIAPSMLKQPERLMLSSTSMTISVKTQPEPPRAAPLTPAVPHVQVAVHPRVAPPPTHELAHIDVHASPAPRQVVRQPSIGEQLNAQQQAFAQEAQRLHAQNNLLSVSNKIPKQATATYPNHIDSPGYEQFLNGGMAVLESTQQWYDGNQSCHYAHYHMVYNNGGVEDGILPWPVCYPRNHDLLSYASYDGMWLPVPAPQPGYVLPAGTYLTDFLKWTYHDGQMQ